MKQAIWNFIIDLLILLGDGACIALFAINGWWWAMGLTIIFVPHSASELNCSYIILLQEILYKLRGEDNTNDK